MTSPLIEHVGQRIKQFRTAYGERGISQDALATKIGVATNTISRWETATVRPTIEDTESQLALGVSARLNKCGRVAQLVEQCPFKPQIFSVFNNLQGSPACHKYTIIRS